MQMFWNFFVSQMGSRFSFFIFLVKKDAERLRILVGVSVEKADYRTDVFQDQRGDRFYKFYKLLLPHIATLNLERLLSFGIEFNQDFLRSAKQKDVGLSLALDGLTVLQCLQRVIPSVFFDILQHNGCTKNPKESPLLHFSALCNLPDTKKFKNFGQCFSSFFSFLREFVVSSSGKSGFRVSCVKHYFFEP